MLIDSFFPDISSDHLYSSDAYIYSKITPWALLADRAENSLWANSKGDPPLKFLLLCLSSAPAPREERGDLPWEPGWGPRFPGGLSAGQAFRLEP